MYTIESYEVYDSFGLIRKFSATELDKAENFCHNRPDCVIKPIRLNLMELLGEALF